MPEGEPTPKPSVGITAGGDVSINRNEGKIAIGEHIYQIDIIINNYKSEFETGKFEQLPEIVKKQLNDSIQRIQESESEGTKLTSEGYTMLAESFFFKRDYAAAIDYLDKAIEIDPKNIKALSFQSLIGIMMADERLNEGRNDEALIHLRRAEKYFPSGALVEILMMMCGGNMSLAVATKDASYLQLAKQNIDIALFLCPGCRPQLLPLIGRYHILTENFDMAIQAYTEAIRMEPESATYHFALGRVCAEKMVRSAPYSYEWEEWRRRAISELTTGVNIADKGPEIFKRELPVAQQMLQQLRSPSVGNERTNDWRQISIRSGDPYDQQPQVQQVPTYPCPFCGQPAFYGVPFCPNCGNGIRW